MNQGEGSGSDDDDEEAQSAMDKALAAAVLQSEMEDIAAMQIDPAAAEREREQEIMAEVQRRRAERDTANMAAVKQKSDAIFERFDVDRDGYMNYAELKALGAATGGELPRAAFVSVCEELGADPSKGVSKALLLLMYTDAGLGDAHRDHNLIFGS